MMCRLINQINHTLITEKMTPKDQFKSLVWENHWINITKK